MKTSGDSPEIPSNDSKTRSDSYAQHPTTLTIRILHIDGLPNVRRLGTQSPYCTWRLMGSNQRERASGRTLRDSQGGEHPKWQSERFFVLIHGDRVASLEGCTLNFAIKTARLIPGVSTTIAKGSYKFEDLQQLEHKVWREATSKLEIDGKPAGTLHFKLQWAK